MTKQLKKQLKIKKKVKKIDPYHFFDSEGYFPTLENLIKNKRWDLLE